MKNSQIYSFILCIWLFSCQDLSNSLPKTIAEISRENYSLLINIEGIPKGKAYLNIVKAQQLKIIDSATLTDKQFIFNGEIKEPALVWLTFDYTTQGIPFILEPTQINISAEVLHIKSALIKGGSINDSYSSFKNESSVFFSKIATRYQRFQKARLENDSQQLHLIYKEISDIKAAYLEFCLRYVHKHPDAFVSLIILNDLIDENVEKNTLNIAFLACTSRLKKNALAQTIKARINRL
ncbi:MAG: hypothetical protein COB98_02170 [Flavobacteriaceae bacterium]|nr:MAG: hypothetical protein COB98_02170 [Flavobacteriaceae bacterium]